MAVFDVTSYGAKSNYNPAGGSPPTWNTDNTTAFANAIAAAKAAGGGTVYIPGGGTGYRLNSRYDAAGHPNQILPTLDVAGVRIVGDPVGRGGSLIIVNQDYDVFRIGAGDGTGGWAGGASPEGFEISGLTIQAAKGFYGTKIVFHVFNALSVDIHHVNITDYGFAYGVPSANISAVFALIPSGPNAGWPYAKLPRPGVTTDPRGAGYQSADMGRLGVGCKYQGVGNYKNFIRDGQVNGVAGPALETGLYNDNVNTPQGCVYKDMIVARTHNAGCVQYTGDGSNQWINIYSFQNLGEGFMYLPPSAANAGPAPGYGWDLRGCGADYNGGHGFYVWDQTGGGQTVAAGMRDLYAAGSGAPEMRSANWPTRGANKGILFQNGIVSGLEIVNATVIVNGGDGAEVCATVGPCKVWDSLFAYNAQALVAGNGSGLYVNNNTLGLNVQRCTFQGGASGSWANNQGWGFYSNNTNITVPMFHGNVAQANVTGQYNHGVAPTINADNA